jgi:hypothetical protein
MSSVHYSEGMTNTTKLLPGTRVKVLNSEVFGTIVPGIAPSPDKVLVQLDTFSPLGAVHALHRDDFRPCRMIPLPTRRPHLSEL